MGVPSVLFFDAQFLMESSPVSSPTVFSSASSDTSICSSDFSTAATTLACDAYVSEKSLHSPQEHQYAERLSLPKVQPILPRPLHILPHTAAPPRSCLDTPSSTTSVSHTLSHVPVAPRRESQWPYGIDPSRLNKDLPELPKERKRVWRAIRRSVSHIFHRHHPKDTPRPASHIRSGQATPLRDPLQPPNSAPLKPSSASVISPRPRISSVSSQAPLSGAAMRNIGAEPSPAYIRKQQLRRSRSFSGYPVVLGGFADERRPPANKQPKKACNIDPFAHDDDRLIDVEGMDEAAAEAFEILREVQKTWRFAPLNEDDPAFQDQGLLYEARY
ncbi:hypothetical protein C0993_003535 [Termitomyces sp. T159_Od127]|nr:hypothetical protein C0993_003535 [Termitomyces sp. T159_Od127]